MTAMAGGAAPSKVRLRAITLVDEPVPVWMAQPHLVVGYRLWHRPMDALLSIFTLHGETLSIFTHALGVLYVLFVLVPHAHVALRSVAAPLYDHALFAIFFGGLVFQLTTSVAYHVFRCVSPRYEARFLSLDVSGIVAMIGGSALCGFLNGFSCRPWVGTSHVLLFACPLACALHYSSLSSDRPALYARVVAALVAAVAWGAVPCAHMLAQCGGSDECRGILVATLVRVFGFYGAGFLIFTTRFPERLAPGRFDIVGHSHQLWHVAVVLAGRAWLLGMLKLHALKARDPGWCTSVLASGGEWGLP